jgi:hypothetical protein
MTKAKPLPSQERLRELFHYDPDTGVFTRKVRTSNSTNIGDVVGTLNGRGYLQVHVDSCLYNCHRLAWMYVYGVDPGDNQVDHANSNRSDNRIDNLRLANQHQNSSNCKNARGVYLDKDAKDKPWYSKIMVDYKSIHLGTFDCPLMARLAYLDAKKEHHGEFAPTVVLLATT